MLQGGQFRDARAIIPLLQALSDSRDEVRMHIAHALGQLGDRRAVEPLIKLVYQGTSSVACFAASALGDIGDMRAFESLMGLLSGQLGNGRARHCAAAAIGKLKDIRALDPLLQALRNDHVIIRIAACHGLGFLGDARALTLLEYAYQHDNASDEFGFTVKDAAAEAINRIREGA